MAEQEGFCGHCGDKATKHCSGCKNIKYRTVECQTADWYAHKHLCATFAQFSTKPGPKLCRVIYLPVDDIKPQFIWLPTLRFDEDESAVNLVHDEARALMGSDRAVAHPEDLVRGEVGSGVHLGHNIQMACRARFVLDGSVMNKCLEHLTRKGVRGYLKGPVILFGSIETETSDKVYDLDCSDLTIALEQIVERGRISRNRLGHKFFKMPKKVKCLKVNNTAPFYEEVDLPRQHPAFYSGKVSQIAKHVGYELFTYQYPAKATPPGDTGTNPAAVLQMNLKSSNTTGSASVGYGTIPSPWNDNRKSILVVHGIPGPILGDLVRYFCQFCELEVRPLLQGSSGDPAESEKVLSQITGQKFRSFLARVSSPQEADNIFKRNDEEVAKLKVTLQETVW